MYLKKTDQIALLLICTTSGLLQQAASYKPGLNKRITNIALNAEGTEQLFDHWYNQAVSGLIAAIASRINNKLPLWEKQQLQSCSKVTHDMHSHAKCLRPYLSSIPSLSMPKSRPKRMSLHDIDWDFVIQRDGGQEIFRNNHQKHSVLHPSRTNMRQAAYPKRVIMTSYNDAMQKHQSPSNRGPFNVFEAALGEKAKSGKHLAEFLSEVSRTLRNRFSPSSRSNPLNWRQAYLKLKYKMQKDRQLREDAQEFQESLGRFLHPDNLSDRLKIQQVGNLNQAINGSDKLFEQPKLSQHRKTTNAQSPIRIFKDLFKIIGALTGNKNFDATGKTIRLMSPKFFSLMPENETSANTHSILSPNIFSFHNETGNNAIAPLPRLLKSLGKQEREAWMDFIIEASGAAEILTEMTTESDSIDENTVDIQFSHGSNRPTNTPGYHKHDSLIKPSNHENARLHSGPQFFTKHNFTEMFGKIGETVINTWEDLYSVV